MTLEMSSKRPSLKRKYSELAQPPAFVEDEEEEDEINDLEDGGTFVDGIYIPPATKPVLSFDPTGPRLIITKIENNFFKSYARLQVLGPFHKCFNAIVGPNGSGKSNVIDSMLFVFGYRATKIRSKKLSVLLHNSEGEQNVNSCTVSVHFALIIDRDGDGYDVVPNSEFYVSRVANKDNSSYYMLNGKKVPFKEVGNLLKSHGIDLTYNRFLILQGEVEQIAMMKCKAESEHEPGMLEYLEDVIGTTRYKKPIMLVNERVESLAEHRNEKLNRLKMVEAEVEVLKAPMEEAVGFLKTENNIILSQNIIYQTKIIQSEKDLKICKADVEHIHEVEGDLVQKLENLETEKEEKQKILKEETTKHEGFQTKLDWLNEAFNKANSKDIQLQESMTQMNATRKKTKQLAAEERIHLEKLEQQPEKDLQALKECEKKEESLSVQKTKLVEEKAEVMAKMRDETKELQAQKEELQTDLIDLQKAVDETKSAFTLADSALKIYISNEEAEREKLEKLQERVATTKPAIIEKTALVATLKKKIPATENSLKQATAELNEVRKREDQLLSETKKKSAYLQETRSSMQANKSRGRVLESLMQLKREGKCDGLFGRLGDLGAIDQKYDVAISTACGPLDNIVVDNVTTAQFCIEFLKHHDIGRATFIALDKQDRYIQEANSKIRTPENVHRLFDLIQVEDDRIRPAFYYAIRDTLVANDLEQASRIAYGAQRFRVVTLKGDLIETTGTMSGGGKSVSRGRMGQTVQVTQVDPQELENIELVIQQNEVTLREYRQKQASLQDQIRTLEPELRKMKIDLERLGLELQSLKQQEPLLLEQLKKQEVLAKNTKANPVEVKKLKAVVDAKREEYEQAKATADELQKEVDKFSKQIHEKTTGKIQVIDKKIKEVTKSLDKMKSEIVRLKVSGKTIERNVKKSEEKIQTMDQDVENMGNRLRQMKEERSLIEDDAKKLLACIEDINENIEAAQGAYTEVKEEVAAIIKKENKIRSEKVDVDAKVKALEKRLTEYNSILLQWEAKLNQLKLQEVPNETTEPLKKYTAQELDEMDLEHVQKVMDAAKNEIKVAKPNLQAIQEYQKKQAVYVQRSTELQEITLKRDEMRKLYDKLRFQRKSEFMTGFNIIKMKLKEMYQMITLEGDADFEMVDTFDPFTEGIQFNVRPPKKSWKQISNLSGGEKTLSSLALVFALHYYKPSPLYVMDEIDAALDFKNVSIVGRYIQERTKNAQFIIISLRSNMFELCDVAVGIFKTNNRTKSITINPKLYAAHHSEYRLKVTQTQTPETEDIIEPESDNLGTSDEPMEAAQEPVPVNSENLEKPAEASDLSSSISSLSECNENVADSVENMDVDS